MKYALCVGLLLFAFAGLFYCQQDQTYTDTDLQLMIQRRLANVVDLYAKEANSVILLAITWVCWTYGVPLLYKQESRQDILLTSRLSSTSKPKKSTVVLTKKKQTPVMRRPPRCKNKSVETTGARNKKIKAEAAQYFQTREAISKQKREMIHKIKHLVLSYWARCHRQEVCLQSLSSDSRRPGSQAARLRRELVVLENCLAAGRHRLESLCWHNKHAIQHYQMIHQQLLGLTNK